MIATVVFDIARDRVTDFWWSDTRMEAEAKRTAYRHQYLDTNRYEISLESEHASYNLDNACGY